jgi:hypothetical protein
MLLMVIQVTITGFPPGGNDALVGQQWNAGLKIFNPFERKPPLPDIFRQGSVNQLS